MTDYDSFCRALKIFWIQILNDENINGFWKNYFLLGIDSFGGNYIWCSQNG